MNALEEYCRNRDAIVCDPVNETRDLAAIAELEAELATEREHPTSVLQCAACQRLAVVENCALTAENERLKKLEDAVYNACFDHNSVDMSGKVRWARAVPVSSVLRQIFDAYGSEPLTPNGTVPGARAEKP